MYISCIWKLGKTASGNSETYCNWQWKLLSLTRNIQEI